MAREYKTQDTEPRFLGRCLEEGYSYTYVKVQLIHEDRVVEAMLHKDVSEGEIVEVVWK
jgi:hypothetical protein